jgi:signal transduction histidine kinase
MMMEQHHQGQFFADAVRGRTLWEAFPFGLDVMAWELHRTDLENRRPFRELELCVDRDDGSRHWLAISGIPRFNASGGFRGFHGVARDISGHKEAERVLLRHNEELQRAVTARTHELQVINRDLEAFARQLAHELRTPIGHIQGLAQLLLNRSGEHLANEDRQLLDLQLQSARSMRETVDALLNLARSTMQPMPTEVVDVSVLAQDVIDSLPQLDRVAEVRWTVQPGLRAVASPGPLKIVLTNLLSNAAKFTRRCEQPSVQLKGHLDQDGAVNVIIEDNGAGFDPNKTERLFKPFGRLHTEEDYHGTGIGLTIVQRIVERHGGKVSAEPRAEGGARFSFTLPAQTPQNLSIPEEITA